ncbi:MAG TPA: PAS domain-containing protein [Desulfomicrobiaceae bacterium]|nr:PAS domain-containing protein [Desulfomicrobiaceae bacterium]
MNKTFQKIVPRPQSTDSFGVVDSLDDLIVFCGAEGNVVSGNSKARSWLEHENAYGRPVWELFNLEGENSMGAFLKNFDMDKTYEIRSEKEDGIYSMRIVPLPRSIAVDGGYVVIATDVRPLLDMHEEIEEQFEETVNSWEDSIKIFHTLFESVHDCALLLDGDFRILAANARSQRLLSRSKGLLGRDCRTLIMPRDRGEFDEAMRTISVGKAWSMPAELKGGDEAGIPVTVTLRRVDLNTSSMYHVIFRDLSKRVSLEENLQQRESEMEDMNIALRQIIKSVEEEKQEFKDELAQQVREQVLPFLERIADEESSDVRMSYKTAIQDQIAEFVDGTSEKFDSVLFKLTPREIEICRLIQLGRRGKEIAEMLSISFETLQTHRKNIRRKLGIKGSSVSLYSFLLQQSDLDEGQGSRIG